MAPLLSLRRSLRFPVNCVTSITGLTPCEVCRWSSHSHSDEWLRLGSTKVGLYQPKRKELVPQNYAYDVHRCQSWLRHIQWIAQKDVLGQDMFLMGSPSSLPRMMALAYCELTGRETEYVSLSRDTTETDLKQRREITSGTVHYINQPAVESALEGRVLVLEGVEKAERNVLPVLNNLLENREMQLDDGRLILAPQRYDTLVQEHGEEMIRQWNLLRANERFRVIAIGVPVPPYRGNPLDPPLRSRFQARSIQPPTYQELFDLLRLRHPNVPTDRISQVLEMVLTLQTMSTTQPGGPLDLTQHLQKIFKLLSHMPELSVREILRMIYPSDVLGSDNTLNEILKKFSVAKSAGAMHIHSLGRRSTSGEIAVDFKITSNTKKSNVLSPRSSSMSTISVLCGSKSFDGQLMTTPFAAEYDDFIATEGHQDILAKMMQSHRAGDFCLVGEKGTGKETLVQKFASLLGYEIETIVLYQDMTSRELLQQRSTLPNGDTIWRMSPLVNAALQGKLAVLDGVHRLHAGTLSVIKRLLQDRELSLMDGTRLLDHHRYETTKTFSGLTDEEMAKRKIYPVHPAFRVVGVGEPVKMAENSAQPSWLSPEALAMFQFICVPLLPTLQERQILENKVPNLPVHLLDLLLNFTFSLRTSSDPTLQSLSGILSTRQLIRIARRLAENPSDNVYHVIHKSCLSRFLPQLTREALSKALRDAGINPPQSTSLPSQPIQYSLREGYLELGSTRTPVKTEHRAAVMVPDILFYDNQEHLRILEDMVKDYTLGEHLLLVGNQGVGKNKIADRFLQLLNLPREYIQLHRDTTVQALTLQPTVEDGVVTYQDSPLVRAVQFGRVLVVDEADKAPTNVTCILKNIIGRGDVTLTDGRRIVHGAVVGEDSTDSGIIPVHPDFRMIALANRPGFPFLGNDFYAALGDMFSCHAIDNPDLESELTMLRLYGKDVPEHILKKLVAAFSELRAMADEGLIAYPYSTREVVAIVKHLQEYPSDGVSSVVRNVFDFDSHNQELLQVVMRVLHKHGIPVGASADSVRLSPQVALPALKDIGAWTINTKNGLRLESHIVPVTLKGPTRGKPTELELEKVHVRGREFSEMISHWKIPLDQSSLVASTCVGPGHRGSKVLHVGVVNPLSVMSMSLDDGDTVAYWLDLSSLFPVNPGLWAPQVTLAPLSDGKLLLHEGKSNSMFAVDVFDGCVHRVTTDSIARSMRDMLGWGQQSRSSQGGQVLLSHGDDIVHLFERAGTSLQSFNFIGDQPSGNIINLPFKLDSMHQITDYQLLLTALESPRWYILDSSSHPTMLYEGVTEGEIKPADLDVMWAKSPVEASSVHVPNCLFVAINSVGVLTSSEYNDKQTLSLSGVSLKDVMKSDIHQGSKIFPQSCEVVLPTKTGSDPGLALVNLNHRSLREITLPQSSTGGATVHSSYPELHLNVVSDGQLVTVDQRGAVRILETGQASLERSLGEWRSLVGHDQQDGPLRIQIERESGLDVSAPKHGKVDPDNTPHVGGNTWAGGTGGRDTAGLGGKGGPYRLDAGHDIHQIPDWEKDDVPEEVKKAAREMGQKAKIEKLREIGMSEHDHDMYQTMYKKVQRQIQTLRVMLTNIQSRSKEREWIRHQTSGDLDERKLIEGLAGEKAIYKRRGEKEPEIGADQVYPKRIRLVVDVSGSMYRFNSYDDRLERSLEAVLVVMEAFDKQSNFKLDIVGHSGDSIEVPFVQSANPPANDKERLQVLKAMIAESQYCWTGDNTVEATRTAIQQVTSEPGDEYFVVILSDANFSRYGIKPRSFASLMNSEPRVNVFAIFIGSLGDQANRLREELPPGRSLICMNNKDLPQQLQQILLSNIR